MSRLFSRKIEEIRFSLQKNPFRAVNLPFKAVLHEFLGLLFPCFATFMIRRKTQRGFAALS